MARLFGNGVNQVTTCVNAITPASSGTISIWVNPSFNSGSTIVENYFWDFHSSTVDVPSFQVFSDNNIYAGFTNAGNTRVVISDAGLFTTGTWGHWVLTWTSSLQTLYLNGVSKGTQSFTFSSPGSNFVSIGNNNNAGSVSANSALADFAFWNGLVLSAGEITALAQGARPGTIRPASLALWLPLDGIATSEPDFSGNADWGSSTGSPALAFGPPFAPFTPRWPQTPPFVAPPGLITTPPIAFSGSPNLLANPRPMA